jgi:hypothetical protein
VAMGRRWVVERRPGVRGGHRRRRLKESL